MGKKTPTQRAKTRNPHLKTTRHVANRHARKVSIPNQEIKRVWDTRATLTSNYERLGLTMDPNATLTNGKMKAGGKSSSTQCVNQSLLKELEVMAASAEPVQRHMSEGEVAFVQTMIKKHGEDYDAMARDAKLNPFQQTASELRRKVTRFRNEQPSSASSASD